MSLQSRVDRLVSEVKYDHRLGVPYNTDVTPQNEEVIEEAVRQGLLKSTSLGARRGAFARKEVRLTPVMRRNGRLPTYNEAKGELWETMEDRGWEMSSHNLKVPHASFYAGRQFIRVWFRPRALHAGYNITNAGDALSQHVDLRRVAADGKLPTYVEKLEKSV